MLQVVKGAKLFIGSVYIDSMEIRHDYCSMA